MTEPLEEPHHILLVEDNEAHAELVIHGLKDLGLPTRIHHVSDGEQALDYLFLRGRYTEALKNPRPALVLLDLRLPRVDGLEVLKTIKTTPSLSRIPVVVLTSSDAESDISQCYEFHANSFLVKPLDFRTYNRMLKDLGNYWLGLNVRPMKD